MNESTIVAQNLIARAKAYIEYKYTLKEKVYACLHHLPEDMAADLKEICDLAIPFSKPTVPQQKHVRPESLSACESTSESFYNRPENTSSS